MTSKILFSFRYGLTKLFPATFDVTEVILIAPMPAKEREALATK